MADAKDAEMVHANILFQSELKNETGLLIRLTPEQVLALRESVRREDAGLARDEIAGAYHSFAVAVVTLVQLLDIKLARGTERSQ